MIYRLVSEVKMSKSPLELCTLSPQSTPNGAFLSYSIAGRTRSQPTSLFSETTGPRTSGSGPGSTRLVRRQSRLRPGPARALLHDRAPDSQDRGSTHVVLVLSPVIPTGEQSRWSLLHTLAMAPLWPYPTRVPARSLSSAWSGCAVAPHLWLQVRELQCHRIPSGALALPVSH